MFIHDVHDGLAAFQGPGDARRVLEFRDDVHQADAVPVFFDGCFQSFRNHALVIRFDFDEIREVNGKSRRSTHVGRAFDEDDVAFVEEELTQERKTLLGASGNDDIFISAVCMERCFHAFGNLFTQGHITFRRAVLHGLTTFFFQDFHVDFHHFVNREKFRCRKATGEGNNFRIFCYFQNFTDIRCV